jgi:hypothetical protein
MARPTHGVLAELVAAERPSVSQAVKELHSRGPATGDGARNGLPPTELRDLQATFR